MRDYHTVARDKEIKFL